ncbi:hypothetical protein G9A89_007446 [Geosiphon pyriformis]|nr:hypothetical protein G9A89_007446 [Geosiphon pyriformis]
MDSLSGNEKSVIIIGIINESLLDLAANTPKAKCVDTSAVEIAVKKSFALDINLSAVNGKSITVKTQFEKDHFIG